MSKEQFLDPSTGPFKRLDDTAWYIKNRDGKPCYFLNMHTKYQQMPDACFKATAEIPKKKTISSEYDFASTKLSDRNFQ